MTRVLLCDDQDLVRAGFRLILDLEDDLEVVGEAKDGQECLRMVASHTPDVVLMDIRMPRMDGVEATRQLVRAGSPTRVLVLTTFDLDEYVYDAMRAGASGFLLKDVPREQLVFAVRMVARGDAVISPKVTRRLVEHYVGAPPPTTGVPDVLADLSRAGARGLRPARERSVERRDRGDAGPRRSHREDPRRQHLVQAEPPRPDPGGRARVRVRLPPAWPLTPGAVRTQSASHPAWPTIGDDAQR